MDLQTSMINKVIKKTIGQRTNTIDDTNASPSVLKCYK